MGQRVPGCGGVRSLSRPVATAVSTLLTVAACTTPPPVVQTAPPDKPESHSVSGALPADETEQPAAACARAVRPAGWVATENQQPGDGGWRPSDDRFQRVAGYLGEVSARCGDTVDLHLSGTVPWASVAAYRIGWYGGRGARLVWSWPHALVPSRSLTFVGAPRFMVEADWPVALQIPITSEWTPGYYVLEVRSPGEFYGGYAIPFVIRDASGPSGSGTSPLLFQAAVLTYQAYNGFGGYSLYEGAHDTSPFHSDRSRVASFDRPYGSTGYHAPFLYDVPLVMEIEKQGLDVDYTTDIDVDRRPSQVAAHRALLIGGHSEYWTRRMYDAAYYARDHGTNLAFFGANTVYWHARLEASPSGPDRRMAVYRSAQEDPLAGTDPSQATVQWRKPPLNRPEAALVGADYVSFGTVGGAFRVLEPDSWIFGGTGATADQTLAGSLNGEFDAVRPESPATPEDIDVIAAAPVELYGKPAQATMSYYSTRSGAGVFSAGTTYWPCQVLDACDGLSIPPETSRILASMTENVLRAFASGPAGRTHPARRHLGPSAAALIATAASPRDVAVRLK